MSQQLHITRRSSLDLVNTAAGNVSVISHTGYGLPSGEVRLYQLDKGVVFGTPPVFGGLDDDGLTYLGESVNYEHLDEKALRQALESIQNALNLGSVQAGTYCVAYNVWSRNVWHWIAEDLPRILLVEASGRKASYIIPPVRQFADSLLLAGIDPSRIVCWGGGTAMLEKIVYSDRLDGYQVLSNPDLAMLLRTSLLRGVPVDPAQSGRRLYVARRDSRWIHNDDEFTAVAERFGFQKIYLEDYSLREQITMAAHAEALIGPHGAGMIHSLFMPRGSFVMELFSAQKINHSMFPIAKALEHDYVMLGTKQITAEDGRIDLIRVQIDMCEYNLARRFAPQGAGKATRSPVLKVDLVNTFEAHGGAARAANRLFQALCAAGVETSMLVRDRNTPDSRVRTAVRPGTSPTDDAAAQQAIVSEAIGQHFSSFRRECGYFSLDRSIHGSALMAALNPAADIVNLHWVAEFLDWRTFFAPGRIAAPVVWTLHDMRAFTGGCHYNGDCRGYLTGCGRCPFFGGTDPEDPTRHMLARQRAALAGWQGRLQIVTPSRWLGEEAARSRLLSGYPVTVIPYSIDLTVFQAVNKAAARTALGLPADARILLFVAHDLGDPRKGFAHLVPALPALQDIPDAVLLTVGHNKPEIQGSVRHLHVGSTDDEALLNRLYAAADLTVLPTLQDNLPNIILESLASGTPVVGFSVGGVPDHIRTGETGFLVPPRDSTALAAALRAGLSDGTRLAAMAAACRSYAEREFAPAVQAARYDALFRSLLQNADYK